jgi:asparagine synthase (glutamine-hydrolysing)
MCGISGILSENEIINADIRNMTSALAHRGPDAEDVFINANSRVALGHRRLSVIDPTEGANQPMISSDGRFVIVFNGEIYNYRSLRKALIEVNPGIHFETQSDTEVLLYGFINWGTDLCAKLEGMFAFAIYDQSEQQLFLCRDRVGKKPLYYHYGESDFLFASEIKSLLKHPVLRGRAAVNYSAINTFLHLGYMPEPETAYVHIKKFPAGHFAFIKSGLLFKITRYSNLDSHVTEQKNWKIPEAMKTLQSTLVKAVEKRLISDVPLGAFLSGGTDSSLIVALASRLKNERMKTFSIGFREDRFDESAYARKISTILKTDHVEYQLEEAEAVAVLEKCLQHFDEPFADTSAIPMMLVSKLARREVTVALTGDGGDELFMGYGSYDWANALDKSWMQLLQGPLSFAFRTLGNDRFKRVAFLLEKVKSEEIRSHIFSQEQYFFTRKEILSMSCRAGSKVENIDYEDPAMPQRNSGEKQALYDLQHYLKDDLLVKVDRASMFYGLECRCPFLDPDVISVALNLPADYKKRDGERKWILKEMLKDFLPRELIFRQKHGFSIPLAQWMKRDLAYLIVKYLDKAMVEDIAIVKYEHVAQLKNAFRKGQHFLYHRLWVLIVAHKWLYENTR